jgi:hypothetical protein
MLEGGELGDPTPASLTGLDIGLAVDFVCEEGEVVVVEERESA